MEHITFTEQEFAQFKDIYAKHSDNPKKVFKFKNKEFVVGYAKYLIKYLESKFMKVIFTKQELFIDQCPSFNFELDADQLLAKALEVGFVTKVGDDQYEMNTNY
jgi:hypothetical protein